MTASIKKMGPNANGDVRRRQTNRPGEVTALELTEKRPEKRVNCQIKSRLVQIMHRSTKFKRVRFLSLSLLGIFGATAHGQSVHELFGTDKFHRAYTETSEVTFEQFQELAWEARARAALPWLNLDRPTPPQIARLSASESAGPQYRSVDFRAPLDPSVRRATYLLISADDVVPVTPVELKGTASFNFDPGMTAVTRKTVTGTVVGKASHAVTTAAFVVVGKPDDVKDARPGAKFEKRKTAGPAVYDFTDGSRTVTWTPLSKEQPDAASAFSFRLAGQQLLLVKWKPEVCESSYTLFSVDAALKPIASNDYDCDT
jgi:hypothetical protein